MIDSIDTTAWKWNMRHYEEIDGVERIGFMPKNEEVKLKNYPLYKKKVQRLLRNIVSKNDWMRWLWNEK